MKFLLAVGVLGLGLAGCAERLLIRPTELAVFNGEVKVASGDHVAQRVLRLELANGRMVEVNPPVVAYITTSDGVEHTLCSPFRVFFENGAMAVRHACGPPERFLGSEISKVEVEEW